MLHYLFIFIKDFKFLTSNKNASNYFYNPYKFIFYSILLTSVYNELKITIKLLL